MGWLIPVHTLVAERLPLEVVLLSLDGLPIELNLVLHQRTISTVLSILPQSLIRGSSMRVLILYRRCQLNAVYARRQQAMSRAQRQ